MQTYDDKLYVFGSLNNVVEVDAIAPTIEIKYCQLEIHWKLDSFWQIPLRQQLLRYIFSVANLGYSIYCNLGS